jgi:hypothetical protein
VFRTIVVPYQGINVVIQVKGGAVTLYAAHDSVVDANAGVPDGWSTTIVGTKYVCVQSLKSNMVFITVNGTSYGAISALGGRRAYVDTSGAPKNVDSC